MKEDRGASRLERKEEATIQLSSTVSWTLYTIHKLCLRNISYKCVKVSEDRFIYVGLARAIYTFL